ncbi:type I restriction endonuclease subunit R [Lactobacillus crispatus]|uniref:Type I restriction enzyme endonuclease subunit n=1 Tax=Lactobacillus crispatus TaxID=47770 RepID=A0A7H9EA25_9LACO|nr:HsdR family type I site-specific deoxyribonuclease [Lactobacillus crispatus]QLL74025.1 HsdR family type I site-specific deoxyribonuclease [Lactobacillus crispatus]
MELESTIENKLISQLIHGKSQWTYRQDLKNEQDLWNNFFDILEMHNKSVLNDVPLTDNEKEVIRTKVVHSTFYKGAEWLVGANHQVRVQLQRDDTKLGIIDLLVLDNTNISGGSSVYEVVNQIQYHKRTKMNRNRRGDVTLMINGLPLIHIELKNKAHGTKEAFNQIQKYIDEQVFNGIYSTIQMFVVSDGTYTQYIAAGEELREKFLTNWVDENNKPVQSLIPFAREVLSIPAAHNMIADYEVLDNEQKNIILLRPYQIHAIEAIKEAAWGSDDEHPKEEPTSGFIWHTTGSGKTLTSYKVAHNLLRIPSLEKTVFLIDRKDLDTQTTQAFQTYAENDSVDVEETENSYVLARKLTSPDKKVVVTTRQKMQALFKRIEEDQTQKRLYQKLRQVKLAFVVDECHRAVSPDQKNELDSFFKYKPLWYGFTGTPIFAENAREEKGSNARTTEQQYGPCLHKYTIKDAIRDNAVLGFNVEEEKNYSTETDDKDHDELVKEYLSVSHMKAVVKEIIKTSYSKLGIYNKGRRGYTYSALFTTSSIKQAQKYYKIFRQVMQGTEPDINVDERIKEVLPDFPKVAITYSVAENTDEAEANQNEMKESLDDYNKMFNTNFSMANLGAYNNDVNNRLARKKKQFKPRDQQLDIVIVVDRLLTGFDAPVLSTLYIDRAPMPYKDLIQAFSRTNRIFDADKKYGQIVTFQFAEKYKEDIDSALRLYTGGGEKEVLAPTWKQSFVKFKNAEAKIIKYKNGTGQPVTEASDEDKKCFLKEYQDFDKNYAAIQTYREYDDINPEDEFGLNDSFIEDLHATYEVIRDQLKPERNNGDDSVDDQFDPNYELESWNQQTINYAYIVQLIQAYLPSEDEQEFKRTKKEVKEIDDYIAKLGETNPTVAKLLSNLWNNIKNDPHKYKDQQVNELLQSMIDNTKNSEIDDFAEKYCLKLDDLKFVIRNYDPEKEDREQAGLNDLINSGGFEEYHKQHSDTTRLHWRKVVRDAIKDFYKNHIAELSEE